MKCQIELLPDLLLRSGVNVLQASSLLAREVDELVHGHNDHLGVVGVEDEGVVPYLHTCRWDVRYSLCYSC